MKILYIVRHAKSSWKFPDMRDIERPLNRRGKRDAPEMAQFIGNMISPPDIFLSSPSKRTYETAQHFLAVFGTDDSSLTITHDLYHASASSWKHIITHIPDENNSAMLFGHNPGVTDFVNELTNKKIYNIPTCGVACIQLDIDHWEQLQKGRGELKFYHYPKEIPKL